MKKIFLLPLLIALSITAYSQIVINEVSYNPPESGSDSLEYIELHNTGASAVDMSGWYFTQGVTDTFPMGTTIDADGYFVVAVNAAAMQNVFGITARQWTDGGLSNGGEDIAIVDASGMPVDSIDYDDADPWVTAPDGNGPSLELCLTADDNLIASNWLASTNGTGIIINGNEVSGTPGAANSVACPAVADHFVTVSSNIFTPADITITVGETVQWDNTGGTHNINGTIASHPNNPASFGNGPAASAPWSYSHTFDVIGVYDYNCDPHQGFGMVGTVTVEPAPPADLVITEIMYNNPGTDDFEFIELYNRGTEPADLTDYTFTQGVTYTFPATTVGAGEYLVVALSADNMMNTFGVTALEWTEGGLSNGGEDIVLTDAIGTVIDSVDYDDANGWARIADGEGPSLVLCDVNADNADPANWSFSTTNTGVDYGFLGNTIFASPGVANAACATAPYVFVDGTFFSANEGDGTVTVGVNLASIGAMDTTDVTFTVEASSTATDGADYTIASLTFGIGGTGPGSWESADLEIALIDDSDDEFDETIVLTLSAATNGVVIGTSTFTVTIEDNDGLIYPEYDIAEVTTNDMDGVADSIGVICELQGIVHGVDLSGSESIQFTIIDATGGIGVFSSNSFGYTVTEGDELQVLGEISQFNGLTQINPDTVILLSSANPTVVPPVVTTLDESTESELVRINDVTIVDPADWTGSGSGFNVDITDGTNTYTMRIDNEVDLYGMSAPIGSFDVIGIGGQFDSSSPFTSGYQLLPRYMEDIIQDPADQITAIDDEFTTDVNVPITMDVLSNDQTPNGVASIAVDMTPSNGSVSVEMDNTLTYTPNLDYCGTETFTYIVCEPSTLCDTATVTVNVTCPISYPQYPISLISTVDQNGVADSLGVNVEISGIVYGVDLQGNDNIQFTLIDPVDSDGGIGLFSSNDFGYTVTEGDEVVVRGAISQFNGLTQINPDTLFFVSAGNALHDAEVVTSLNEVSESKLVKFEGMSFVDPTQWDNMGSGMNIDITDGTNTITMRIDNDVDLYSMPIPAFSTFNVTGIGGQFDSSDPFDSGYQLLPRYMEDIEESVSVIDPTIAENVSFFPNPVAETLFVSTTTSMQRISLTNILGQEVLVIDTPEQSEELQMGNLPSGIYVLTFTSNDRIWSVQVVKE